MVVIGGNLGYLEFEETWRDTCSLLGAPLRRGPTEKRIKELLAPLELSMRGSIELDHGGRFYLRNAQGRMEISLVAEGLRKLGIVARLIATSVLFDKGFLFWDEPEANLHPTLIRCVAETILSLCGMGIQVFIATHSLFLLREIDMLLSNKKRSSDNALTDARFFGLHESDNGVIIQQGSSMEDIGDLTLVDEELKQSDRFLELGE